MTHLINFINTELSNGISLEKLHQLTYTQWGHDKAQNVWWYWRQQFDNFDNHDNDFLIK